MKHNYLNLALSVVLTNLCLGLSSQVQVPFTQRTSVFSPTQEIYSVNGDFTMIGNTNMTLQAYSDIRNNSNNTMIKVDEDDFSSTNNSSLAMM